MINNISGRNIPVGGGVPLKLPVLPQKSTETGDRISIGSSPENDSYLIQINILHMNDIHGQVSPLTEVKPQGETSTGGLAWAKTVIDGVKAENPGGTLTLNAGDIAEGTMEAYLTKGQVVTAAVNQMGFDATTLGNHDFAWGRQDLDTMVSGLNSPVIAANIIDPDNTLMDGVKPYIMKDLNGVKVAVIGLDTPDTGKYLKSDVLGGVRFEEGASTVRKYLPEVRSKGADLVVVLSHLGFEEDKALASSVDGIDVIVGGHSHTVLEWGHIENGTVIVQAGSQGRFVGNLQIDVDRQTKKIVSTKARLLPVSGGQVKADPDVLKILEPYYEKLEQIGGKIVGRAEENLPHSHSEAAKLNQIYADSLLDAAPEADFALGNARKLRGNLTAGDVPFKDIYGVIPFTDENAVLIKATGKTILTEIESRIKTGGRGIEVPAGFTYEYNTDLPDGSRVTSVRLNNGEPLDPEREYKVAIDESTLIRPHFEGVEILRTIGGCQNIFCDYFQKNGPWKNDPDQRIVKRP